MFCCENCFSDAFLKEKIQKKGHKGNCDFCGKVNRYVINVKELSTDFKKLADIYKELESYVDYNPEFEVPGEIGIPLFMLINEDWDIFSKEIQDYETDRKLLNAILNTYSEEQLYIGIENGPYSWDMHWNLVKQEIKHGNRFFPDFKIKPEIFSLFKFQDKTISTGQIIYRARIGTHIEEEMKAPPAEKAVAGRANPRGISYLYCSTDPLTCVSEIRPWKGAKVTIAEMIVNKELVVLDLSNTKFSPFILENSEDIITVRMLVGNFSQDISQPINPEVAELDYLPTQYITEIIKRIGYDGIYFKSSLGLEYNIVIFDQNNVSVNNIEYDVVRGITYETDKHSNQKRDIEDDLPLNLFD